MLRYVGLDVHRGQIEVCIIDGQGRILQRCSVTSTRASILEFAQQHLLATDEVALEATGNSWAVAAVLRPYVARLVVSNPLTTKAIAQSKIKTDKIDAFVLAQLLRCRYLPEVWQPDEATERRRSLTHRRATLISERTRLKNRIHGVLAQQLIPLPKEGLFTGAGERWLAKLDLPRLPREYIDSDLRLLEHCQEELDRLEPLIRSEAYGEPQVKLLMSLPGVDYTVALAVIAALGPVDRFPDGAHAAAYLGLVPSTRQSGPHRYHGPITRRGNARARWLLIQAAQHLGTHPGPLGVFFRRLHKRKNRNVAVVATARKLVVIAWHMLRNGEPYRYALPRPTQEKLARLRVRATGERKKTGPRKGAAPSENYGTGRRTRTEPALPDVYAIEELPQARSPEELSSGEQRMLKEHQVIDFVAQIQQPQRRVRKAKASGDGVDQAQAEPSLKGVPNPAAVREAGNGEP